MTKSHTLYEGAPEMLLNAIAEAKDALTKAKPGTDGHKFWTRIIQIMEYSWDYMDNTRYIHRDNTMLRMVNKSLTGYLDEIEGKLAVYEAVRGAKLNGTFEEVVESVERRMKCTE